jgi:hypothetical protein
LFRSLLLTFVASGNTVLQRRRDTPVQGHKPISGS